MKKALATIGVASVLTLTACGGDTVYVTVTEPPTTTIKKITTTLATTPPLATRPPSNTPSGVGTYDPDLYDNFLWSSVNDFWWLFTTDQLLQMGLLVCEEFDRGSTIDEVTYALIEVMSDTNTIYLSEGMAGVVAGALTFLCPEHGWWLETI